MKGTRIQLSHIVSLNCWTRNNPRKFLKLSSTRGCLIRKLATTTTCKCAEPRVFVPFHSVWRPARESRERGCVLSSTAGNWKESSWSCDDRLHGMVSSELLWETEIGSKRKFACVADEMEPSDSGIGPASIEKSTAVTESSRSVGAVVSREDNDSACRNSNDEETCVLMEGIANVSELSHSLKAEDCKASIIGKTELAESAKISLRDASRVAEVSDTVKVEAKIGQIGSCSVQEMNVSEIPVLSEAVVQNALFVDEAGKKMDGTNTTDAQKLDEEASVVGAEIKSSCPENSIETLTEDEFEGLGNLFSDSTSVLSTALLKSDKPAVDDKSEAKKSKKQRKRKSSSACIPRPNYFLGIPVSSPEIYRRVLAVQEEMLSSEAALFPHLIDVATLHLTLFVFHLQEEELSIAKTCMANLGIKLTNESSKSSIALNFRTLGDFNNRVVFVSVSEDDSCRQLAALRETALQAFEEAGVVVQEDGGGWHPHLTVAKISPRARKFPGLKALRKIPASSYAQHKEDEFGVEHVSALQLLSMTRPKDSRRYYQCESSVQLRAEEEEGDHTACCFPRRPARPEVYNEGAALSAAEDEGTESPIDANVTTVRADAENSMVVATEPRNISVAQPQASESTLSKAQCEH